MASNGSSTNLADTESSLEKIKRQLTSGSGRHLLQGPLLKRSETLRKWNERWVILDPTTGKMEYKIRRNEPLIKGIITFDSSSTITLSLLISMVYQSMMAAAFILVPHRKRNTSFVQKLLALQEPGYLRYSKHSMLRIIQFASLFLLFYLNICYHCVSRSTIFVVYMIYNQYSHSVMFFFG
ncbi:hypothetical protein HPP92_018658 [Vanilla planifolia]|uniref:PH domain-containing protein n=1 Tax=Vanilla planifolia TaxID=51239 RepID=A0A835UML7_VANPL|nr:hypothetical protein HPP92_018658 [Vanilla planifolia]